MYPYMEAWDEVALWEANEKYGALFDKYFPELTTLETLLPPRNLKIIRSLAPFVFGMPSWIARRKEGV